MVRASRSPFHRARQSALAARPTAKSAIPITDPNQVKPAPEVKEENQSADEKTPENHPSSTAGPIAPAPRPTTSAPPEISWNSLDMGGINLKNIPRNSGLFSFVFLENLYGDGPRSRAATPMVVRTDPISPSVRSSVSTLQGLHVPGQFPVDSPSQSTRSLRLVSEADETLRLRQL